VACALNVHSEIAPLKKVLVKRPGAELLNISPGELDRLLFDDVPFLEVAQQEHDAFTGILRAQGAEVVYLDDLVAQALDAVPGARGEFVARWLDETGISNRMLLDAVHERLDAIDNTLELVRKTMSGIRRDELDLPGPQTQTLARLVGEAPDGHADLIVDPMPSLYFTRDPFAVVGHGVCLNHMYATVRNRESLYGDVIFRHHPDFQGVPRWYVRENPFHIEGGDILNLNARTVAVGISQRTQAAAIDTLAQAMFWGDEPGEVDTILAFSIPSSRAFMHLDTVFTQIDYDKFTIHPLIMGTLRVFRMTRGAHAGEVRIEQADEPLDRVLARALGVDGVMLVKCGGKDPIAASREQWNDGSNTLCLSPGVLCVYQRNTATNEALRRAGMELHVMPSSELSRGRGGPRCMSMPLWRED